MAALELLAGAAWAKVIAATRIALLNFYQTRDAGMKQPKATATLAIDGVYYFEASEKLRIIQDVIKEFYRWEKVISETNDAIDKIFDSAKTEEEREQAESLCIKLDRDWQSFNIVAETLVQSSAICQILCAACLEAHINMRAAEELGGNNFEQFDKLSLVGKWLFYTKLVGLKNSFEIGAEPFQSFQALVTRRNALLHYKRKREEIKHPYDLPKFVERLGLDARTCKQAVHCTSQMATALARFENREGPAWVSGEWYPIFAVEFDR